MSNEITTIVEEYTLPSKGLVYDVPVNPRVKLRSMTVADEMKRLSATGNTYRAMSEMIEDCIIDNHLGIHVYDLCLGDYTFLLHKLRIATYGPEYKLSAYCSKCNTTDVYTVDLDTLLTKEFDDDINELMTIKLPHSKVDVKLKFQTPRDLDWLLSKRDEMKEQFPGMEYDPTYMLTLQTLIREFDGKPLNPVTASTILKSLDMMDANFIFQSANKLNERVGLDNSIKFTCKRCGAPVSSTFRITSEFFGPEI